MTPVICVERLTKHYGRRPAVQDVSFEVEPGQVLGLLGPNGSGKSTILRILTGYLAPTSGRARVAGHDVASHSLEVRRSIGYVAEDIPLYPHMTVDEFLRLMAGLKGVPAARTPGAIDAACDRLSLQPVRRLIIGKLSRGYRQRVAIAQALLAEPALLVLDEPTNGLDPAQIIEMRHLIGQLAQHHTIVVTSHVLTEIEQVATHVAILLAGRMLRTMPLTRGPATGRLRVDLPPADANAVARCAASLSGISVISSVPAARHDGVELIVHCNDEAAASALAGALLGNGFGLRRLVPLESDLESLFLQMTSGAPDIRIAA